MYRIPRYKIQLLREGSQPSPIKRVESPLDAAPVLKSYLKDVDREHFVVMMLDTKNQIIGISTVSVGSLNTSIVCPREVFKPAVLSNAAGVILCHNHPSGDPSPSKEDIEMTCRLCDAGKALSIKVLDHVIIGDDDKDRFFSMKEHGLVNDR